MSFRTKSWLRACGVIVFFGFLFFIAQLLPKPVDYRIYGVEDEATGGWMLARVQVDRHDGPKVHPFNLNWKTADGQEGYPGTAVMEIFGHQRIEISVSTGGSSRRLSLDLLALGEQESAQTGWEFWGRASYLIQESTVLKWQPAMPNYQLWKSLEKSERNTQWELLEKEKNFSLTDWLKSLLPDEPKSKMEMQVWQNVQAMGDSWVVLERSFYDYSGGAHGNGSSIRETFWADNGTVRLLNIEELFVGKTPWQLLMPHLRKAYTDWGKGGSYLNTNDVEPTLRSTAMVWPNAQGMTFSYDSYAIAPYSEGSPDLRIPLAVFADAVDWNGPAKFIWPKESAKRAKKP